MTRFNPRTVNGHSAYEAISALQKAVRRGELDNAMYWATDLDLSGFTDWLWRRILIMVVEDVGPAWPEGPAVIKALYDMMRMEKDKQGSMFTYDAIVRLVRAPKNRIVDHAMTVHWTAHGPLRREVPDEAFDKHTARGKQLGRGIDHFLDEAAKTTDQPAPGFGVVQEDDPEAQIYKELERKVLNAGLRDSPDRVRAVKRGAGGRKPAVPVQGNLDEAKEEE